MKQATQETPVALAKTAPARASKTDKRDSERPLVEDIRLLGRILGDVIRTQEGPEAYDLVEQIRKLSVAFRRDADHEAGDLLQANVDVRALPTLADVVNASPLWLQAPRPDHGPVFFKSCGWAGWDLAAARCIARAVTAQG